MVPEISDSLEAGSGLPDDFPLPPAYAPSWLSDQGPGDRGAPAARGEHQACGQGHSCWADQADADPQGKQSIFQ